MSQNHKNSPASTIKKLLFEMEGKKGSTPNKTVFLEVQWTSEKHGVVFQVEVHLLDY